MDGDKNSFNNGGGCVEKIPPAAKELVDSLKEVVKHKSCTDAEIYAALRDCHMNPNDAVHNLLAQDTFQEVKSKRERRKEVKGSQEPRVPGSNSTFDRGFQFGHYTPSRISSTQSNYNSELSKAVLHKREIGQTHPSPLYSSTSTTYQAQQSIVHEPSPLNDPVDDRGQKVGWGTTTGNLSMAVVMRKGLQTSSEKAKPQGTNQDNECPPVIEQQIDTSDNAQSYLSGDDHQPSQTRYVYQHQQAAQDLHQLNLGKESVEPLSKDNNNLLVFPNNLQTLAADCPGLSFGTYNSGISSVPQFGLQDESTARVGSFDNRNTLYRGNEQLPAVNEACNVAADAKNYFSQPTLQPEQLKQANSNANVQRENIPTSSSVEDSNFKQNYEQISKPTVSVVVDRNARNIHPYVLQEMVKYTGGMPAHVFSSLVSSLKSRYPEQRSPFLAKQAMPQIYNNAVSSMGGATLPISEVDSFSMFSSDWHSCNPASSFAPRTALRPNLSAQANAQHSSSLRELFNAQRYRSMADTVPNVHAFAGKNNYPQYIGGGAAMSSLPYSNNANASGYRNFGISANITPMGGSAVDYADTLHSQYNNRNNFPLQQQNNNSGAWRGYIADSRAMPVISPPGENRYHQQQQQGQYQAQQYGRGYYPSRDNNNNNNNSAERMPR